ncbi:F-box/FBD/LRR-repeat protein [Trifolium pratense]|uniref:F-box/FBD/LRR-repeat protein n=1 Tax=Trifolium pratense TaxID=57577 RepID=A0A2K3LAZ1_TRIPR|nr:F-box/FBD/LRR-repeat protein [Trifolium pratense]
MSRLIDIISALPDALLHHILFFLPTKEAAATMTLSKRWKPLLSIINLDDQHFPDPSAFREMFNSFTTNRDKTLPIHSFQLTCRGHNHYCKDDIPNFVNAVVQRNVENLSIDLSNSLFPTFVLTTKFLSVLKLKKLLLDDFRSVDLPSLKFLCLESVTFTHHSYLIKILSACPVLEELETKDLTVKKIYGLHRYCPDTYVTWLSKLARANISGRHVFYDCLNNAEHLQLHVTFPYGLHNMFHNLTYIELALDLLPRRGFFKWNWLMKLLPKSPKLQTLIIHEVCSTNLRKSLCSNQQLLDRNGLGPQFLNEQSNQIGQWSDMSLSPTHWPDAFHLSTRPSVSRNRSNLLIERPSALNHVNRLPDTGKSTTSISSMNCLKSRRSADLPSSLLPFLSLVLETALKSPAMHQSPNSLLLFN